MHSYSNPFPVVSLTALIDAVKGLQVYRPLARFALFVKGESIKVHLLSNGYVELNGTVPTLAKECEIDEAIKMHGGRVLVSNEQFCPYAERLLATDEDY